MELFSGDYSVSWELALGCSLSWGGEVGEGKGGPDSMFKVTDVLLRSRLLLTHSRKSGSKGSGG